MSQKKVSTKTVKGRVYSGVWANGEVGWWLGPFVSGGERHPCKPGILKGTTLSDGDRLVLCEVTLKPVVDKMGRPITRIYRET